MNDRRSPFFSVSSLPLINPSAWHSRFFLLRWRLILLHSSINRSSYWYLTPLPPVCLSSPRILSLVCAPAYVLTSPTHACC